MAFVHPSASSVGVRRVSLRAAAVSPSATLTVDAKAKALQAAGVHVVGFGAGEPDFPTPDHVVEAAIAACRDPRDHHYTPTAGLPALREAIADKTLRESGYAVDAGQVLVAAPYWTTYPEAVALAGGAAVFVFAGARQGFRVTVDQLERAVSERTK